MTKLSTKNIGEPAEVGTDFIKKVIQPGKQQLKILEVILDKNDQYGDKIILRCETLPVGGPFVGFPVDKNTPNGDCYLGQVGAISLTRWGLKDFTSAGGVFYSKIDECLKNIKMLCVNLGLSDWLDAQEGKHDTIDDYINALNAEKPFTGIIFWACVCGREYMSKNNYVNYELFLPQTERMGKPLHLKEASVLNFSNTAHIIRIAKPGQASESAGTSPAPAATNNSTAAPSTTESLSFTEQLQNDAKAQQAALAMTSNALEETPILPEIKQPVINPNEEKMPWD